MKAVFLDYSTLGADTLDSTPLFEVLPDLEIFQHTADSERGARIADTGIVLTNKVVLDGAQLRAAKKLKMIGLAATGCDNIDTDCAAEMGIAVCNIRAYCSQSVAEHVLAVLLNLAHGIARYERSVRNGEWQTAADFCLLKHPIRQLSGMTLGIIGFGELGRAVGRMAGNFGMTVMVAARRGGKVGDGQHDFETVLQQADAITLHCPLNDETRHLFGANEFAQMKSDAFLINTARGGLIDSAALARALDDGEIAAAAIDVLAQEPPVDGDPLLTYRGDKLILTPHIAWAAAEARQQAIDELAANTRAFLDGQSRNRIV